MPQKEPFRVWVTLEFSKEEGSITISQEWYLNEEQLREGPGLDFIRAYCDLQQQEW